MRGMTDVQKQKKERPGVIEFLRLNPRSKGISGTAARLKR